MKTCSYCKKTVSDSAKICLHCASDLTNSSPTTLYKVMNIERSLQWSTQLMRMGLAHLKQEHRFAINRLMAGNNPIHPPLGQDADEVEIAVMTVNLTGLIKFLLDILAFEQSEIKVDRIRAYYGNGEPFFEINNGFVLITNKRILLYNFTPEWHWQTPHYRLNNAQFESEKSGNLQIFMLNGAYYELVLSLPRTSMANVFTILSEDSTVAEASINRVKTAKSEASGARALILGFFNELVVGARQIRTSNS